MSLRKVSYEGFAFSVFPRNQEKTKPLTWLSVSSEALQSPKSLPMCHCQASTCGAQHGPYVLGATRNQQKNQKPKYFISFDMYFISFSI